MKEPPHYLFISLKNRGERYCSPFSCVVSRTFWSDPKYPFHVGLLYCYSCLHKEVIKIYVESELKFLFEAQRFEPLVGLIIRSWLLIKFKKILWINIDYLKDQRERSSWWFFIMLMIGFQLSLISNPSSLLRLLSCFVFFYF